MQLPELQDVQNKKYNTKKFGDRGSPRNWGRGVEDGCYSSQPCSKLDIHMNC